MINFIFGRSVYLFLFLSLSLSSFSNADDNTRTVEGDTISWIDCVPQPSSSYLLLSDQCKSCNANNNDVFNSAIQLLNNANESILVANYVYENQEITEILNRKAEEGLEVIVVFDRERSKTYISQLHPKIIQFTRLKGEGHMHHKFLVVDHQYNWISSANFNGPLDRNLALLCWDPDLAEVLYHEAYAIHSLHSRTSPEPFSKTIDGQKMELYLLPFNDPNKPTPVETEMNRIGREKLLKLIEQAKATIRVSMVIWTFKDSARALVDAKKRGVKVEVIGAVIDPAVRLILSSGGILPRIVSNAPYHHKWMLIDDEILWTGSANWSMNAFSRTDDSVTVLYNLRPEQQILMEEAWQELLKISKFG